MGNTVKTKLKRKEDELKQKYLEHINTSLAQAKDKNNGRIPNKMVLTSFNHPSHLNHGSHEM